MHRIISAAVFIHSTSRTWSLRPQATGVKYHGNLIPLNQRLALTRLRATGHRRSDFWFHPVLILNTKQVCCNAYSYKIILYKALPWLLTYFSKGIYTRVGLESYVPLTTANFNLKQFTLSLTFVLFSTVKLLFSNLRNITKCE